MDKAIEVVAPTVAAKRAAARAQMKVMASGYGNYGGGTDRNTRGWEYFSGSADEDIHAPLPVLRQKSRDLYMGVPLATGALRTYRSSVVGSGLSLKSQIDGDVLGLTPEQAERLETQIEREFALWADTPDCDMARLDNFYELQQLAFLNWLMSGDVIALLPTKKRVGAVYDLRVRMVEADRLSTPDYLIKRNDGRVVGGVEVATDGEVVAYHIAKYHPGSCYACRQEWVRVAAYGNTTGRRNVLHLMTRERPDQRRGVPLLAPVIETLKQMGRYTEAELVAAVVNGLMAVFIEKQDPSSGAPTGMIMNPDGEVDEYGSGSYAPEIKLGSGSIIDLAAGEKANAVTPGRPNANYDGFVASLSRHVGAGIGIPYEVLVKNFTASYSASRGALLEAWKEFRTYRDWLANDFCQPIFEEWMCEAVAKGRIAAPGFWSDPLIRKAYCGAMWYGPSQGQLDPVKEVKAAEKRIELGLSTRAREAMEMTDTDFNANMRAQVQEEKKMKKVRKQKRKGKQGANEA